MANSSHGVSRRGMIVAGAALSAGAMAAVPSDEAQAAPRSALDSPPTSQASPVTSTIASPRQDYVVYRTVGEFDISVESASAERQFGGRGVHAVGAQTSLWASVDVPGGVRLYDVEFYATNTSGGVVYAGVWLWTANDGYFSYQLAQVAVPSASNQQAVRVVIPSAANGTYPTGTKLFLTMFTPTNASVQWNGARVGMLGGGNVSIRRTPARVYDSRTTTKLAAGQTQSVAIDAAVAFQGTVGFTAQVTILSPASAGFIQVWPYPDARPTVGELLHGASSTVFNVTCALPVSRSFRIYTQRTAHIVVDVVGVIS